MILIGSILLYVALVRAMLGLFGAWFSIDSECDIHKCIKTLRITIYVVMGMIIIGTILVIICIIV